MPAISQLVIHQLVYAINMEQDRSPGKPKVRIVQHWKATKITGEETTLLPDGTTQKNHTFLHEPRNRVVFIGSEKAFEIWKRGHVLTPDMEVNSKFVGISGANY
jgi:hypothetical protein